MKKLLLFSIVIGTLGLMIACGEPQKETPVDEPVYVDLGLPSGTLWKDKNESGQYKFQDALKKFGDNLPYRYQMLELIDTNLCKWEWEGGSYKVTGPNGNFITLPAEGYADCNGDFQNVGYYGGYWSSEQYVMTFLREREYAVKYCKRERLCNSLSVRLVKYSEED